MIIDIILIALVIIGAIYGHKKGFAKILVKLLGFIIAIVLAFMLRTPIANLIIENTDFDESIKQTIEDSLNETSLENEEVTNQNMFYEEIIDMMGIDEAASSAVDTIILIVAEALAFIAVFLAVLLIVGVLQMVLDLAFKLPILGDINSMLGFVFGGILTAIKILVILSILQILSSIVPEINGWIQTTYITKFLYESNILMNILFSGIK